MATDVPYTPFPNGLHYPNVVYSHTVDPNSWYILGQEATWKATYYEETDPLRAAIDAAVGELRGL